VTFSKARPRTLALAVSLALGVAHDASAVYLNPDGLGQALIYPYYTVRSAGGNPFNTYITVVNHETRAKAVRVRFREGRNGREVANFNLYLSPNDAWSAALSATADGAKLATSDNSCVAPPFVDLGDHRELVFSGASYSGANSDGFGDELDRTREGYVEMIEMATLTGVAATAVTHNTAGIPPSCGLVVGASFSPAVDSPTGGLSGTGTLINVASGMDFTYNAEALANLSTQPFFRNPSDPYPDWNAAEITPASHFITNGRLYHATWGRGVDAVSSVLMRTTVENEFILDPATLSQTDWVLTFPTRRFYVSATSTTAPFTAQPDGSRLCERVFGEPFNRSQRTRTGTDCDFATQPAGCPPPPALVCWSATVISWTRDASRLPESRVLGSANLAIDPTSFPTLQIPGFQESSGWATVRFTWTALDAGLRSPAILQVEDLNTGQPAGQTPGQQGLPVMGFMVRTFVNGTLTCSATRCQGNYGGLFPHKYSRSMLPP
jgi:hypothetical protein